MSRTSSRSTSVSETHHNSFGTTTASSTATVNSSDTSFIVGGKAFQDSPVDNQYAASSPAKGYPLAFHGAFAEGTYTEF